MKMKNSLTGASLREDLKVKSRRRHEQLQRLDTPSRPPSCPRNDLLPKLELVYRAPKALRVPARKLRKLDAAHVREVAVAISHLGFCDPVLIDENNDVLDGVVRVEAGKVVGLRYIPCIRAKHLSASERRLVRLTLNRLSEKGSWDFDELKLELEELIVETAPIEITGFSMPELDQILIGEEASPVEQGPLAPEANTRPIARLGDVFAMGEHRIVCGDATDPKIVGLLCDDEIRLILTDEPYNVPIPRNVTRAPHRQFGTASGEMTASQFQAFNTAWMGAALPHLCDGGVLATFIDWRGYAAVILAALELGLTPVNLVVWAKTSADMGSLYRSQHELLPIFKKGNGSIVNNGQLGKHGRWRSNVWTYPGASSVGAEARQGLQQHPTVKPVAMLEDALMDLTNRGDTLLDPFLGSGSMLIAAEKCGRRCRGLELDPLYVDVILRRYAAITGCNATLESTGESYPELAKRRAANDK